MSGSAIQIGANPGRPPLPGRAPAPVRSDPLAEQVLHDLTAENGLLERAFDVHRQLTAAGLEQVGATGVLTTVARLLGRRVTLAPEQASGLAEPIEARARWSGPHAAEPTLRMPVTAAGEPLGELLVYGDPLADADRHALEHGAAVLAAELLREREAREVEWRLQGELLEELVASPLPLPATVRLRAEHAGVDLSCARHVVVVDVGDRWRTDGRLLAAARLHVRRGCSGERGPALVFQRADEIVLALPAMPDQELSRHAAQLEADLRALGAAVELGASRASCDLAAARREAHACARLAAVQATRPRIVAAPELGPFAGLLDATSREQAEALVREQLGALARHDRDARVPLLETVAAFVEAGGHVATAAERCFVHATTLTYRLGLAAKLLDGSLDDVAVRFELQLAVRVLAILEALGGDPLGRLDGTAFAREGMRAA